MKYEYDKSVFINCPFDSKYKMIFHAIVFAVFDCGFVPRCSLEYDDGSDIRISKILKLIEDCRFAIHDIFRTELDEGTGLPRFNMPLELGVFLGIKYAGNKNQKEKVCLIFDVERFRFQSFISDIAGQDIHAHKGNPELAVRQVRNWLSTYSKSKVPGASKVWKEYLQFQDDLPGLMEASHVSDDDMNFRDYTNFTAEWLKKNVTAKS